MVLPFILPPKTRRFLGRAVIMAGMTLIAAGGALPFVLDSPTLFYKFGLEKNLLLAGKVVGITAFVLLVFQVAAVSRFRWADRVFGLNRVVKGHRFMGILLALLALAHPLLILGSEGFTLFPFEKRYWPQFLGVGISCWIICLVGASLFRRRMGLGFQTWQGLHRIFAPLTVFAAAVHVIYVSDPFKNGWPQVLILVLAGVSGILIFRIWRRRLFPGHTRRFRVGRVVPAGPSATLVELEPIPDRDREFPHLPGQFAFITPTSSQVPKEEHPFTLASFPARPGKPSFIIAHTGDWTRQVPGLVPGDSVVLDGPFGLFSHLALPPGVPLVMVAGGIGITPMLAMLQYISDSRIFRTVFLVWSCKTRADMVLPDVFESLEKQIPNLRIIRHFTREPNSPDKNRPKTSRPATNRLNRDRLATLLRNADRDSHCFVCGPPGFMNTMCRDLADLCFARRRIHRENFSL